MLGFIFYDILEGTRKKMIEEERIIVEGYVECKVVCVFELGAGRECEEEKVIFCCFFVLFLL